MLGKRLIKSNDAGGGGCTNTVDLYNPFPDGGGVALYQLNGDATDVSGNYDGTALNVTWGAGQFGQAGVFNGSTSVVSLGNVFNSTLSNNFTISAWVNLNSMGGQIFGKGVWAAGGEYVRLYTRTSTPRIQFGFEDGSGNNVSMSSNSENLEGTGWRHIVAVGDYSGSFSLYLDGQHIESKIVNGSMNMTNTSQAYIGNRESNNSPVNGSIDQVRIFSRALRPYEVEALYTEEYCTPTIVPSEHFNTVLYDGTGGSKDITNVGFAPDLTWVKSRGSIFSTDNHNIYDSIRGANYALFSDLTIAENYNTQRLQSFLTNGFTIGDQLNVSGGQYVAWNFKAGGAAVTNTDGTITSQVSANTEAGFSVVTFTGNGSTASVGHGLGQKPSIIFTKNRSASEGWFTQQYMYVPSGNAAYGYLNTTAAFTGFTDSLTNDTVMQQGGTNGQNYVSYCFAEVEGFSNFGSYVGTGASGNTVVTGFEPAFVMIKRTDTTSQWLMYDNKRGQDFYLYPNLSAAESGPDALFQFLENGFQLTGGNADWNASGGSYIYMAFAADPTAVEPTLEDSFNTVLYNGDAGNTGNTLSKTVTGFGFQPDFVWGKNRDYVGSSHVLFDSVRSPENWLSTNNTNAENTSIYTQATILPDGFTTGTSDGLNKPNNRFVAWAWKGAEIPAINSNGSIPSVVSANPAAGFSIVSYTGNGVNNSTFGHGISGIDMIIIKNRDAAENWATWHSSLPSVNSYMYLDSTQATNISTEVFRGVSSSTVTVGTHPLINANNNTYIAYCFAEVAGFSKFGSYTGNGSYSGPTIDCGFEPAFVMIKATSDTGVWVMHDNKRGNYNDGDIYARLQAESSAAEVDDYPTATNKRIVLSPTGFQVTNVSNSWNGSGRTYIYMAFANQF